LVSMKNSLWFIWDSTESSFPGSANIWNVTKKRNLQNVQEEFTDCTFQFGPKGSFSEQYIFLEKNLTSVKADQKFVEPTQSFE
jgi:hypothetical protein